MSKEPPKANAAMIDALERELGITNPTTPKPIAGLSGYVVLMDSKDREASERVRVTFSLGRTEIGFAVKINGAPLTLTPTRFGTVRAVAVFDGEEGYMPACDPDTWHRMDPGSTFHLMP